MAELWWRGLDDLSGEQQEIITLPREGSHLVVGPPGSGKTNLLLLRANWLALSGMNDLQIVVFTGALQRFIEAGGQEYYFPASKIKTFHRFCYDLFRECGESIDMPANFEEGRRLLAARLPVLSAIQC